MDDTDTLPRRLSAATPGAQAVPGTSPPDAQALSVALGRTLDLADTLCCSLATARGLAGADPGLRRRLVERTLGALLDHLLLDPLGPAVVRSLHTLALGGGPPSRLAVPVADSLETLLEDLLLLVGAGSGPTARERARLILGRLLTGVRGRHLQWQASGPPAPAEARRVQQQLVVALLRQLRGEACC